MRLTLCHPLESRDGTLNADSKLKNMVVENVEGEQVAVKRPGVTKQTELPPGIAQGLAYFNGAVYSMSGDILYRRVIGDSAGTGNASWSEAAGIGNYAIELDPTFTALNYVVWLVPPYSTEYPDYSFRAYESPAAMVNCLNEIHPEYGPWSYEDHSLHPINSGFPSFQKLVGYINPNYLLYNPTLRGNVPRVLMHV